MKTEIFNRFEKLMSAVTFAEKNDHDYAILLMNDENKNKKQPYSRKRLQDQQDHRPQMRL